MTAAAAEARLGLSGFSSSDRSAEPRPGTYSVPSPADVAVSVRPDSSTARSSIACREATVCR